MKKELLKDLPFPLLGTILMASGLYLLEVKEYLIIAGIILVINLVILRYKHIGIETS